MFGKKKKKLQEELILGVAAFAFMGALFVLGAVRDLLGRRR